MADENTLRDFLKQSFNLDLPVLGGDGNQATPIVVGSPGLPAAVDVMRTVLTCLGVARQIGWRLVDLEVLAADGKLVRAGIETVQITDDKPVAQREGLYFVLEALPGGSTSIDLPPLREFVDPRSGVQLPTQIGWLHFHDATDNEPGQPGLGWSLAYTGLRTEGTLYIYDNGTPLETEALANDRVISEFNDVVAAALQANPGGSVKHQAVFRDPAGEHRCLMAIIDLPGTEMTAALLTVSRGRFVKGRITFDATDAAIARMAHESIEAFVDAVRPPAARTS